MQRLATSIAVLSILLAGCGSDDGERETVSQQPADDEGGASPFPIFGGSVSQAAGEDTGLFVSGGLSTDIGEEGSPAGNPVVYEVDANGDVVRSWDLELPPSRHLFASTVARDSDGLLLMGAECSVLGGENPGGCIGGAPRAWRLGDDEVAEPITLPDPFARHEVDASPDAGYVQILGATESGLVVTLQDGALIDPSTPIGSLHVIDSRGGASPIETPAPLLTPRQACVRPDRSLLFAEPVFGGEGIAYTGLRIHRGRLSADAEVSWEAIGEVSIEASTDTGAQLHCSDGPAVVMMPATSAIHVLDESGALLHTESIEPAQPVTATVLSGQLYLSSSAPADQGRVSRFDEVGSDGTLDPVGHHDSPPGQLPLLVELDGQLYDAGPLVALAPATDGESPQLIALG